MNKQDLEIIRLRHGGGKGGQHKNKVETAVRVTHKPTGLVATVFSERSQALNLKEAVKRLRGKIMALKADKERAIKHERYQNLDKAGFGSEGRVRTYNWLRQEVYDHRTGLKKPLHDVLLGNIDQFLIARIEQEIEYERSAVGLEHASSAIR